MIQKLLKLKVDRSKGAPAPHKAILLLSILQLIESGEIKENKVFITPELVAKFKDNWHLLVHDNRFNPNFSLPFYHLKSDGFWHLKTFPGKEILLTSSASIRSFSSLKNTISYAYFDEQIFELLENSSSRAAVKNELLSTYLSGQQIAISNYGMIGVVENQILHEPSEEYRRDVLNADEEEIFIRSGVFKKVIPREYNFTCCISGMRITTTRDIQMIDACHIVPFSETHDDTIKNGISLSPNFHRAFDRFLITINTNFEVIVSNDIIDEGNHIKTYHGRKILLPKKVDFYPSVDNLNWHHQRFLALH